MPQPVSQHRPWPGQNKASSPAMGTWAHLKVPFPKRLMWRHRRSVLSVLVLCSSFLLLVSVVSARPAPQTQLHGSSSSGSRILIWPDEIEDNALTEQNGDFVYKQATAAEKQEQKSSSSIFFWPSSHGGNHHHHRPSRNHSASTHQSKSWSLLQLLLCSVLHLLLYRFLNTQ